MSKRVIGESPPRLGKRGGIATDSAFLLRVHDGQPLAPRRRLQARVRHPEFERIADLLSYHQGAGGISCAGSTWRPREVRTVKRDGGPDDLRDAATAGRVLPDDGNPTMSGGTEAA